MFNTLTQFYNSTEWRKFRMMLIAERRKDGILYCEHSGQPLLKPYDIVLHHIKPLTLENVNDYSVSLNPDNILIVSQKSHNEIHSRFGYSAQKKVYYVYGAPCSGKNTFVRNNAGNSDLICDIDNIWEAVTGRRYYKPSALKSYVFTLYRELLNQVKMTSRTGAAGFERAWIIEGGSIKPQRERKLIELGAEPIFIDESKETCLQRLTGDDTRQAVIKEWSSYIDNWFNDYQE